MELWIARNEDGTLYLFHKQPVYNYMVEICDYMWQHGTIIGSIDKSYFPEVTFDNSPQKVKIELI